MRVKKAGYSYRTPYSKWVRRFSPLLEQPPAGEGQDAARQIVNYLVGKVSPLTMKSILSQRNFTARNFIGQNLLNYYNPIFLIWHASTN